MNGSRKTKAELLAELEALRARLARLEREIARQPQSKKTAHSDTELLSAIVEGLPNAAYVIDVKDYAVRVANSAARATGLFEGAPCYALIHNKQAPCRGHLCPVREVKKAKKPVTVEHVHHNADGDPRQVEMYAYPVPDAAGRVAHVALYTCDLTEQRESEQALRESEERYRLHFEHIGDVMYATDRSFRITSVSPSVERILGYRPDEIVGKRLSEITILAPEYLEQAFKHTSRILAGEQVPASEYEFVARDGTRKFAEVRGAPLRKNGVIVAVVAVARDISRRRVVEEELARYREHLEDLVRARTEALSAANERLHCEIAERTRAEDAARESEARYRQLSENLEKRVQKQVEKLKQTESLAAIGRMVSVVSHEVRNPLQNIQMGVDFLRKRIVDDEENLETLRDVEHGVETLKQTIGDLLNYSRPVRLQRSRHSVREIIDRALKDALPGFRAVHTRVELDREDREILVDAARLTAVFVNLLSNAAEAMSDGGEITIRSRLLAEGPSEMIELSVSDTGSGISEEHLPRITEPFFTTKLKGIGLGLPICKKIVDAHDGSLRVESTINKGTTVYVTLPFAR